MKDITLEEVLELVDFERDESGALMVSRIKGFVLGDVLGDVWGSVRGNVWGDVKCDVEGSVLGTISGKKWCFEGEKNEN